MAVTEIILKENVPGLGAEADIVSVRRGYARNFLIPTGKAYEVTAIQSQTVKPAQSEAC